MAKKKNPVLEVLEAPDMQFAVCLVGIIFLMFIPLPGFILDLLLSVSITLGFLALLIAVYVKDPLEFSTFPTFLLLSTLFRLALNVATTRNILLDGASGDVSQVIEAFGNFVVGGNYFVGFVIFVILVLVNFLVITKGAGRVAEVGARFTLDAMPGKQMSIDADLNAGIIDREEAKKRRIKIEEQADFYGSMDGASKFVRGDAIAGIVITAINIIVGLFLGVLQNGLSFKEAARIYTLLTVGDGLVSQIPSIIISVAAGIVVTKASSEQGISNEMSKQMLFNPKALFVCSGLLFSLGLFPGFPTISFFLLGALFAFLGRVANQTQAKAVAAKQRAEEQKEIGTTRKEESIENLLHVDVLALEVGVGLIPLVDSEQDGEILERIVSSRKQFAQDWGIIVPMVMVRDNIQLKPGEYQILMKGNPVGKGSLLPDHELAMAPEQLLDPVEGFATKEPAYGLDAVWISPSQKDEANFKGYTVVNCATVVVTHLTKIVQEHASALVGRQEVQRLLDSLKADHPKVVEEVSGVEGVSLGVLVKVVQNLLKEGVSIRDFLSICEAIADHCREIKHPDLLTRHARKSLGRSIVQKYLSPQQEIHIITFERSVEDIVAASIQYNEQGVSSLNMEPSFAQKILNGLANTMTQFEKIGAFPVLLCGAQIRWDIKKLIDHFIPGVTVIAFDEVPSDIRTNHLGTVQI